jgi:hypothetical protein
MSRWVEAPQTRTRRQTTAQHRTSASQRHTLTIVPTRPRFIVSGATVADTTRVVLLILSCCRSVFSSHRGHTRLSCAVGGPPHRKRRTCCNTDATEHNVDVITTSEQPTDAKVQYTHACTRTGTHARTRTTTTTTTHPTITTIPPPPPTTTTDVAANTHQSIGT